MHVNMRYTYVKLLIVFRLWIPHKVETVRNMVRINSGKVAILNDNSFCSDPSRALFETAHFMLDAVDC